MHILIYATYIYWTVLSPYMGLFLRKDCMIWFLLGQHLAHNVAQRSATTNIYQVHELKLVFY